MARAGETLGPQYLGRGSVGQGCRWPGRIGGVLAVAWIVAGAWGAPVLPPTPRAAQRPSIDLTAHLYGTNGPCQIAPLGGELTKDGVSRPGYCCLSRDKLARLAG
jgi:hypothetical protein